MTHRYSILAIAVPAACAAWGAVNLVSGAGAEPTLDQTRVIDGMLREQAARYDRIEGFSRLQHYSVTTDRFGLKADLVARVHRDRIHGKSYEVLSRSGSQVIQSHVFDALLDAEVETSKQTPELLTRENYDFHLIGQADFGGRKCYVLETDPKHKEKRLLKGKLWLDAHDFGIVHVEGRPTENLSFWVGKPMIVQEFAQQSGFWWPSRRHSYTDNMWLGKSDLVIEYTDYQFEMRKASDSLSASDNHEIEAKIAAAP